MYAAQTSVFQGVLASVAGRFRRRPSAAPAVTPPPARARAVTPLHDIAAHDSYEPFRDYRPGGRFGDPYRP